MKYAIIGCGRISANNIQAAINNKLDIVALCDIIGERAEQRKVQFELTNSKVYTNYKQMLANERLDLVTIATESGKHASIAIDCINSGVNVIIEKPIALSLNDADRIIEAGRKNNVKVCACHQNRFNKAVQKIRNAIENNSFGKLLHGAAHIRWTRDKSYYDQASWRGTWEQDGGALMNQCIHNIDLLRWMMGDEVTELMAYTDRLKHDYIDAEDLGIAIVKFANGSYGIIEGTVNIYPKNLEETLYIFGEKGTVKAGGKSVNILETWQFEGEKEQEILDEYCEMPSNVYGFGHTPLYADMIDAITNDRTPYVDANAGRRALELVLAIYKSAKEGRAVKFPLEQTASTDFIGRF